MGRRVGRGRRPVRKGQGGGCCPQWSLGPLRLRLLKCTCATDTGYIRKSKEVVGEEKSVDSHDLQKYIQRITGGPDQQSIRNVGQVLCGAAEAKPSDDEVTGRDASNMHSIVKSLVKAATENQEHGGISKPMVPLRQVDKWKML